MKKFFTSFIFIVVFGAYALSQYIGNSTLVYVAATAQTPTQATHIPTLTQSTPLPTAPSKTTPTPVPPPIPAPKPKGQYTDGTYTGSAADAYYGNIQVQVTIASGKIADVAFLQYPNDRNTSRQINSQAMPYLKTEAIQTQSAQVHGVSGATDTSMAFRESLASALSQAKS